MLRKTLFWLHLATGASIALIVAVMSATGVLLTYETQITSWMDLRGLDGSPAVANASALPVRQLIARAQAQRPGTPTAVRWRSQPDDPVEVLFGNRSVFLNAYTGQVLSTGSQATRQSFRILRRLHVMLGMPWSWRTFGAGIVGLANLGFLFLILSGIVLWWPRKWSVSALRNVLFFRRGLRAKARDFNWHHVFGFWALIPLFIIAFSGVVISYPFASAALDRAVRMAAPGSAVGLVPEPLPAGQQVRAPGDLDALIVRAKQQVGQWRTVTMRVQPTPRGGILFKIDGGTPGQPQKRAELVLAGSGAVLRWEPFSALDKPRQVQSLLRYAHTGEVAGVAGQTIAGLVSAASLLLVYTGIALALRRWRAWRGRRSGTSEAKGPKGRARHIPA